MRHLELRPGIYRDSVRLMQISAALVDSPGVDRALVAMATELNLDLLPDMGISRPAGASPNDLLVAFVAADGPSLASALDRLEVELAGTGVAAGAVIAEADVPPRTVGTAARRLAGAKLALVSTPGRYAFVEAMDALDAGLSVMIFSDNVPVEQEVLLKRTAAERGLLVMGPDCGTAVVGGLGLGFANVVRPGPVGLVAASGTGAQHIMSLLATGGVGISHCLGVGGRDLSDVVDGVSTRMALDALDADPATELIVFLSKPPAPRVADEILAHAEGLRTPVLFAPLGPGSPTLSSTAVAVFTTLDVPVPRWPSWIPSGPAAAPSRGQLRGLFSGGTLCVEAMVVASAELGEIRSNIPLRPEWTIASAAGGHVMLDLGADEYTLGRPHPMIDLGPRVAMIRDADPSVVALLLDVVLGHGAHPDPAAELAPAIRAALVARPALTVIVTLVGTPDDPQGLSRQAQALADAGAYVHLSNADATRHAVDVVR